MTDSTKRFSDRVEDYIKYRPNYPNDLVRILEEVVKINPAQLVADIGSGTGISSMPFSKNGYTVMGIEPNKEMREAAEQLLSGFKNFKSVNGSAEQTNLEDNSVDVVFSGQAFHWFDKEKNKVEFSRILREKGNIILAWNERSTKSSFQQEYEQVLYDNIPEYRFVNHRNINEDIIAQFFSPKALNKISLENRQILDFTGLVGRLRSSSYCPKSGEQYDKLMHEIKLLFNRFKNDNTVSFEYESKIYWC